MYQTQNGWTKASIIARILTRNNGQRAVHPTDGACRYRTVDGNHCAVGCFIPTETALISSISRSSFGNLTEPGTPWEFRGSAQSLLKVFPDLVELMPLTGYALGHLQRVHDNAAPGKVRSSLVEWIEEYVRDDPSLAGQPFEQELEVNQEDEVPPGTTVEQLDAILGSF
ncbi:MAG: hypothetical protein OSB57_11455 [Planctomycetota bacterium]|nr:hypothetical protein [Planctomycetota bacterium]